MPKASEVRTPLAAIGGYAELMLLGIRGPLLEAQRSDVLRILEAQAYILRLVDDLVAYSKFETGYLRFDIADEERMRQIVLNLLSNAIKFTPINGRVSRLPRSTRIAPDGHRG